MNIRTLRRLAIFTGIFSLICYCIGYGLPNADGSLANENGWMTAHIRLEGRQDHSGVLVSVDGWQQLTGSGGHVFFLLPEGYHTITVSMDGYLHAQRRFKVRHNRPVDLSTVTLFAGDADGNRLIDFLDLVIVHAAFGSAPPSDPRADINGDGRVNILDALLIGVNLGREAPTPWGATASLVGHADS